MQRGRPATFRHDVIARRQRGDRYWVLPLAVMGSSVLQPARDEGKPTMARLQDKIVLITGAAGGIGSAVAAAVKREGGVAIATDLTRGAGVHHGLDVTVRSEEHTTELQS